MSVFNRYFSQPPNFGVAYDCATHQYPIVNNRVIVPSKSRAYPVYIASNYEYNLPRNFINKMLTFISASNDWN